MPSIRASRQDGCVPVCAPVVRPRCLCRPFSLRNRHQRHRRQYFLGHPVLRDKKDYSFWSPTAGCMAAVQMDPELAKCLFFEGATVVILNMPRGTEFGIDYNSWEVGPKFRGVKMIPPGIHFLHYSSVDKANPKEVGPRMGFFLSLRQRGLIVLHWNAVQEEVDLSPAPEAEVEAMRANLQELDQFLGPYPYATLKKWISLTNFISEATVEKLQPENRQICAFSEVLPVLSMKHTKDRVGQNLPRCGTECKSYQEGLSRLPEMKPRAGTEIRFSELPTQMFPAGATPAEITRHSMDLSYALETVLSKQFPSSPQDVLGELQFAFVCFLLGNVYEAFEHWKRLLNLLCRSEEAMVKHHTLYINLISILYHQLGKIPADFFVDIVSQNNFLTSTLQTFLPGLSLHSTLLRGCQQMELSLEEKELSCEKQLEKNVILSLKSRKARRAVLKEGVSILQSAELGPVGEVTERQRITSCCVGQRLQGDGWKQGDQ
ncbi:protein AAR2 homolog isoform X2 [Manis javanica]|uniref:protein AAR2 homolog isoform X2 n=1 Tax=Manis javanica TaxID=9974 RepID=UPI003C6D667E